jgi:hypothetical protein
MGNKHSQPLKESHTGWSDDGDFVAVLESAAFALFDASMDHAISRFIAQWAPKAAPNAQALRRSFKFPNAKPVKKPK